MAVPKSNDLILKLGLFAFNPILGLFASLRNLKSNSSYVIFFVFCLLFGISFTVPENKNMGYTGDGVSYRIKFERTAQFDNNDFEEFVNNYFEFDDGSKDLYMKSASFMVSRFTDNYHFIFAFYALVFASFMLLSFRFLTSHENMSQTLLCFLLATFFIMSNPIFNINGTRFWTASWVGVYSIFQIFHNNNKRFFLLSILTPLIHVSFLAFVLMLFIALFLRKYDKLWMILFILSFFLSEVSLLLLETIQSYLPSFISKVIQLYTDSNIIETKQEQAVWYAFIFKVPPRLAINFIVIFFYKYRELIYKSHFSSDLFRFLIVWMTFVNFTMFIPSVGIRFIHLAIPIIAFIILDVFYEKKFTKLLLITLVCMLPSYAYFINLTFEVTEIQFYITNPFYLIYDYLVLGSGT